MIEQIKATLRLYNFLKSHPIGQRNLPRTLARVVRWQIASRIAPADLIVPFVGQTSLLMRRGMTGATGNYYVGLHEFEDMALVVHALRSTDLFCDVGANIGSYTILASGVAGARAIAFEPVPSTTRTLEANVAINRLEGRVRVVQSGVGAERGELRFTQHLDTVNHVLADGEDAHGETIRVPIVSLDEALGDECPTVMKIDVEGFELWVLRGAERLLRNPGLQVIVMETNGSATRYDSSDADCVRILEEAGFSPFAYDPMNRRLTPMRVPSATGNTIFARDRQWLEPRVTTAESFNIHGLRI